MKPFKSGILSYIFQVDIEAYEVEAIPEWLSSGALANVDQIALEFHLDQAARLLKISIPEATRTYLRLIQSLYKLGFRLIEWHANVARGKLGRILPCMEVVFKRNNSGVCPGFVS